MNAAGAAIQAVPFALLGSSAEFDALLAASALTDRPVLLTFTGPKCIICRQLAPMLAAVVREAGDALVAAKADAETLADLTERYAIRSLPTTLLFRGGALADRITGFATAGRLREWLAQHAVALAPLAVPAVQERTPHD